MIDFFTNQSSANELLPFRPSEGHKGSFGKVLIVAGSENMAGAAYFAAKACYRTGAGLVKLVSPKENRVVLQGLIPEAILDEPSNLLAALQGFQDAVLIGPGIGKSDIAKQTLVILLENVSCPMVFDADALNLIAEKDELYEMMLDRGIDSCPLILTPHVGELNRLYDSYIRHMSPGELPPTLGDDPVLEKAKIISQLFHCTVVAKKDKSYVLDSKKSEVFMNHRGNSGLATAGSGDVLAGIILGLLAQRVEPFEAAWKGVCLHALAGDYVAARFGQHYVMASDLLDAIGRSL